MKNQNLLIIGVIVAIVLGAVALWMATQSSSVNTDDVKANIEIRKCAYDALKGRLQCLQLSPCQPNDPECLSQTACISAVNTQFQECLGNQAGNICPYNDYSCDFDIFCSDPLKPFPSCRDGRASCVSCPDGGGNGQCCINPNTGNCPAGCSIQECLICL